jgi:hypothetical protein
MKIVIRGRFVRDKAGLRNAKNDFWSMSICQITVVQNLSSIGPKGQETPTGNICENK